MFSLLSTSFPLYLYSQPAPPSRVLGIFGLSQQTPEDIVKDMLVKHGRLENFSLIVDKMVSMNSEMRAAVRPNLFRDHSYDLLLLCVTHSLTHYLIVRFVASSCLLSHKTDQNFKRFWFCIF